MSTSIDSLFVNALEKAVNPDQNDQTTVVGRAIAEMLRGLEAQHGFLGRPGVGADPNDETQHVTRERVHGFAVTNLNPTTRTFTIGPGALFADNGQETPGALDSTYRIGLLLADADVVFDPPASDLFWNVIEAQVQEVLENETRDVLVNPAIKTFQQNSVVKRRLKRVAFRTRIGTADDLPTPEAGWTVLYAFRVPLVLASLAFSSVVDLRQPAGVPTMPRVVNPRDSDQTSLTHYATCRQLTTQAGAGFGVRFNFAAVVNGSPLQIYTPREVGADAEMFLERGVAAIDQDAWYYFYLARIPYGSGAYPQAGNLYTWQGGSAVNGNCLLIVSTKTPRVNGANQYDLNVGPPFNSFDIPAGQAAAVAAVRTPGAAPTRWLTTRISAEGVGQMEALVLPFSLDGVAAQEFTTLTCAGASPSGIGRSWRGQIGCDVVGNGTLNTALLIAYPGFTGALSTPAAGELVAWDPKVRDDYQTFEAPSQNLVATPGFDTPGNEIVGLSFRGLDGTEPPPGTVDFADIMGANISQEQIHVRVTGFRL